MPWNRCDAFYREGVPTWGPLYSPCCHNKPSTCPHATINCNKNVELWWTRQDTFLRMKFHSRKWNNILFFSVLYCYGPPFCFCVPDRRSHEGKVWPGDRVTHAKSPPFNCPHTTETTEPHVRWHATICYMYKKSCLVHRRDLTSIALDQWIKWQRHGITGDQTHGIDSTTAWLYSGLS